MKLKRFPLVVTYARRNQNLQRRIIRKGTHSGVLAASEREARLKLVQEYNSKGKRVFNIETLNTEPTP